MKTLKKIKLTQLNKVELDSREQNRLLGGARCCLCGCNGSSSTGSNSGANNQGGASGLISPDTGGHGSGSFNA